MNKKIFYLHFKILMYHINFFLNLPSKLSLNPGIVDKTSDIGSVGSTSLSLDGLSRQTKGWKRNYCSMSYSYKS